MQVIKKITKRKQHISPPLNQKTVYFCSVYTLQGGLLLSSDCPYSYMTCILQQRGETFSLHLHVYSQFRHFQDASLSTTVLFCGPITISFIIIIMIFHKCNILVGLNNIHNTFKISFDNHYYYFFSTMNEKIAL
jgi:hypothetical protein